MYSIKGHESEMAVVDYRVGWRRIFRCQLGNRPLDLPTFRDPNTVLLYVSSLYGPWTVAAYFPLGAIAFLHRRWKMEKSLELAAANIR
jgi:hypothetical protein